MCVVCENVPCTCECESVCVAAPQRELCLAHLPGPCVWTAPGSPAVSLRSPCPPALSGASPSRARRTMGFRGPGRALACCLLLAFACGPVLGHGAPDQRDPQEPEGTQEPLLDHAER